MPLANPFDIPAPKSPEEADARTKSLDECEYFSIRNFEFFQGYQRNPTKKSPPPWIKLYQSILGSYEFDQLTDSSKWHLISLFLLAARSKNKIRNDLVWLRYKLCTNRRFFVHTLYHWCTPWVDKTQQVTEEKCDTDIDIDIDYKKTSRKRKKASKEKTTKATQGEFPDHTKDGTPTKRFRADWDKLFLHHHHQKYNSAVKGSRDGKALKLLMAGEDPEAIIDWGLDCQHKVWRTCENWADYETTHRKEGVSFQMYKDWTYLNSTSHIYEFCDKYNKLKILFPPPQEAK